MLAGSVGLATVASSIVAVHDVVLRFGMYVISQLRFAGKFFHGKLPTRLLQDREKAIKLC